MPTATVTSGFLRNNEELQPGEQFECSDAEFAKWAGLGFIQPYETKVVVAPEKKPGKSSRASQPARASRKKTAKKRTKKQTK